MGWKDFFKPTKGKIILFIILILSTFGSKIIADMNPEYCVSFQVVNEIGGTTCKRHILGTLFNALYTILFSPVVAIEKIVLSFLTYERLNATLSFLSVWKYLSLVIGFIWFYFLSCLLVWIYNKFRK